MAGATIAKFLFVLFLGSGLATLGATATSGPQSNDKSADPKVGQRDSGKKNSNAVADVHQAVDPSQYVGADTCKTCHEERSQGL